MTKNEALDKIKKLLEESALGGRWSFTDQALALVAEIEAEAPPPPPPAPPPASPEPHRVELRADVLEEILGLLSDIRQPVVPYSADPLAMAQSAISRMQRDARIAEQALRAELPQYFGERF